MPIYEYQCQQCGERTEVLQSMSDDPLTRCKSCEGDLKKLISAPAFQFKGTGWYVTDYAKKDGDKGGSEDKSSSKDSDNESSANPSSDSSSSSSDSSSSSSGDSSSSDSSSSSTSKSSASSKSTSSNSSSSD